MITNRILRKLNSRRCNTSSVIAKSAIRSRDAQPHITMAIVKYLRRPIRMGRVTSEFRALNENENELENE